MNIKTVFTAQEIDCLRQLINLRVKANRSDQKKIRAAMRRIGFYGSAYNIRDCQVSDLEQLIRCGIIRVIGDSKPERKEDTDTMKNISIARGDATDINSVKNRLINGRFVGVDTLSGQEISTSPGLYCIKLRENAQFPATFGAIRDDGIIYIGQASRSIKKRLFEEELEHKRAATFFRSIGAALGYLPPKGSLAGKVTKNYKFCPKDTDAIKDWMRQSLLVNWVTVTPGALDMIEPKLIKEYRPLINISKNPSPSEELKKARHFCVEFAKTI